MTANQRNSSSFRPPRGFTLLEVLAVISVIGLLATVGCPRATKGTSESKISACKVHRGTIEIQAELWRHHTGVWPGANLATIGADISYFPGGLPICPVDGSAYTINSSGRVVGHNH